MDDFKPVKKKAIFDDQYLGRHQPAPSAPKPQETFSPHPPQPAPERPPVQSQVLRQPFQQPEQSYPEPTQVIEEPLIATKKPKKSKIWFILVPILLILTSFMGGFWFYTHHNNKGIFSSSSVVPETVSKNIRFPIYYPNPKKLPNGYGLDLNSFRSPQENGLTYSVIYDTNKKIVFALQAEPSDTELQNFRTTYIPKRTTHLTPVGEAEIGTYNKHLLISIPISKGPWIVATAPVDINQDALKQVLDSLIQE